MPGECVSPPEDARQPPEVIRPYLKPMVKRSVFVVVVADNSSQVRERVYQRYVKTFMGTADAQNFAGGGLARELSPELFRTWSNTSEYGLAFGGADQHAHLSERVKQGCYALEGHFQFMCCLEFS